MKIAVIVPTIRPLQYQLFMEAWQPYFTKHDVKVFKVVDGKHPHVNGLPIKAVMGRKYADLITNFNDGVRNLGFAQAYKEGFDIFISLDDDTRPKGDTIQDHLSTLAHSWPVTWMNTVQELYMRGFPYGKRKEAECVLSHGGWEGVADFDASSQLVFGTPRVTCRKMPVPKGVLFPMCIMNVAFKRKMVRFMYQAPMGGDINRFADIWGGIEAKKDLDERGWSAYTGGATVKHERASDPFVNLIKEAHGIKINESYPYGETINHFLHQRARWQEFIKSICVKEL